MFDFVGKECVGGGLSYQRLDRSAIAGARSRLDRVGLRDARTGAGHVSKIVNAERIAFSHQQRAPAIAGKELRLGFNNSELAYCVEGTRPSHHDVRIEAGVAGKLENEIAESDSSSTHRLDDDRLRHGYNHNIVEVEI